MPPSDRDFKILRALDAEQITSQRQLSDLTGISLGLVNYALKSLFQKGMVKLGNFTKNPRKIGYCYLLTPPGLEQKSKLAFNFIIARLREYQNLKDQFSKKLLQLQLERHSRVVLVGPEIIIDLIQSAIQEQKLNLSISHRCHGLSELDKIKSDAFDIAIILDGTSTEEFRKLTIAGVPQEKLICLW